MRRGRVMVGVAIGVLATGVLGWWRLSRPVLLAAPEPALAPDSPDTLPLLPRSAVVAPLTIALAPTVQAFEARVPRRLGDMARRRSVGEHAQVAFVLDRSPFDVRVADDRITLGATIAYQGRGWYDPPLLPAVSAGCGDDPAQRPRLRVQVATRLAIDSTYRLRTRTRLTRLEPVSPEPRDRCRVTALRLDVTTRVLEAVRPQVVTQLAGLDARLAALPLRDKVDHLWGRLLRPIRLAPDLWLALQPKTLELGGLSGDADSLRVLLRVEARPRLIAGDLPANDTGFTRPLPPLRAARDSAPGLHVLLHGDFTYAVASVLVRKPLVGRVVRAGGRQVRIEDVRLRGIGGGRVALGVTLSGAAQGTAWFTGRPVLDTASRQITVPDLEYDVGSADALVAGLRWLAGSDLRDLLRARAHIPDAQALAQVMALAERGMNRRLTDGVWLRADLREARGLAVHASRDRLRVQAAAEGTLSVSVDRALVGVPRPPAVQQQRAPGRS